jgi:hypothetical protein
MTQQELLEKLNKEFNLDLKGTDEDRMCRWDATSPQYLAELKCRRAHYNTQMIEYDKLDAVKVEADKTDKEFLYCVSTPKGIYVFNISKLCQQDYNFNWENKYLPSNTDFAGTHRRTKKVGYIGVNDSMSVAHLAHTEPAPQE